MQVKKISLLGSTGSIGVNTLELIRRFPDRFSVCALAAGSNLPLLKRQIQTFRPRIVSVLNQALARDLKRMLPGRGRPEIAYGSEGPELVASVTDADMVVSAIVGAAGLIPTLKAITCGKQVALANKETLVMAGKIIMGEARRHKVLILPVDSEHSALFQLLRRQQIGRSRAIILTASGGPFLRYSRKRLARVRPEDALQHPNWKMGKKVTIDSATLMNKGLEVIEARWLFNMPLDAIKVYVHPQSIVHAMLELDDGTVIAHLSSPDMKGPIAHALFYPEPCADHFDPVNLAQIRNLRFLSPDLKKFPCLALAYQALEAGETMPAVLNGANEVAVHAFLSRRIGFSDIPAINQRTMELFNPARISCIDDVLLADGWARHKAGELISRLN
jgi:1-deoxy-D-xylulose-5-phosphate reductoisomerase